MIGHITDPQAEGGLAFREVPAPTPAASDVVVDVRAYAVNRGELNLLRMRPNGWTVRWARRRHLWMYSRCWII